ncbi:MAG: hypothetical protein RIS92_1527, partial [Verrucomicrobiota bacterium]
MFRDSRECEGGGLIWGLHGYG